MTGPLAHVLIAFLVLTGLIFLSVAGFLAPSLDIGRKAVEFLDIPFVYVFSRINFFFKFAANLSEIHHQNTILSQQVEELAAENAVLVREQNENRILREALNFLAQGGEELLPAEIIAWDFLSGSQKATLNRGSRDAVEKGDAVVVSGRILVGVISQVSELSSQMELVTSSGVSVNAQTAAGTTGVVRGEHGLGLLFDLISQNDPIERGDKLVTSGLGGGFPKDLFIGEIGEIKSGSGELFQKAGVIPATNLKNLRVIFVLREK